MKLKQVAEVLEAQVLTPDTNMKKEITCAFGADLISDVLMCVTEPTMVLTGLTNPQIIRLSDMIELQCIVFVRGKIPSDDIIEMAVERELPLLTTKYTLYKSSGLLYNLGLRSCKI